MYLNSLRSACEANRKRAILTAISLAFVPFGFPLGAQQNVAYSTLSGRVTDGSGAVVRGALIQVRSVDTNQQKQSTTGGEGLYRFAYLKPGSYLVSAHSAGFKDAAQKVVLTVGGASTLDFQISVQQAKASIEVSSDLQSQRTQISEVVRTREIDNLPLNGRNYLNLTLLVPNVSKTNLRGSSRFATTSAVPDSGISISGQRNLSNSYLVDGLSNNDDAAGLPATYFSQEVFGEFQVVTSNGTAEFGRAEAGFINLSTRSGTNELHGRAYGFLRNQRLDAVNPLSGTKLPLTWPQYGISAGGPLRRNRTFFFVNYERTRQSSAGFVTISPSSVTAINNALNTFAYPGVRVATGEYPATLKTDTFFSRVDHQVSKRDQIFARYNFYHLSQVNAQSNGTLSDVSRGTNLFTVDHVIAVNNVFTISPRTFNETRAQFFRYPLSAPPASTGVAVNIPGVALFGPASIFPAGRKTTGGELVDALTFESGRHALKLGVDALYQRIVIMQPGNVGGSYTFSSLANFQARRYAAFLQDFGNPTQGQTSMNIGMFAQDEWRLRHNLTVNAGVRYDIQSTPSILDTDFNNIAPRIGFVWSPYGNQKTVIRAGYGLFYGRIPARIIGLALQRDQGRFKTAALTSGQTGAPVFPNALPVFLSSTKVTYQTIARHFPVDSSTQVSFQIDQQFAPKVTASVAYNHLRGLHLSLLHGINVPTCPAAVDPANLCRPNPNFGNIDQYAPLGDSWFDGFTTSVLARPSARANLRLSYTLSKAIDDTSNAFTSTPQTQNDIRADRGLSDNDQRHRVVLSAVLTTPAAHADGGWDKLRNGFTLSSIFSYGSPLPFNVLTGNDRNGDSYTSSDRPFGVGRNTGVGFVSRALDVRLARTFSFSERWRLEGIVEGFNVLNTRNNQSPNNIFGTGTYPLSPLPNFGVATAAGDPRQIQIAARLYF